MLVFIALFIHLVLVHRRLFYILLDAIVKLCSALSGLSLVDIKM